MSMPATKSWDEYIQSLEKQYGPGHRGTDYVPSTVILPAVTQGGVNMDTGKAARMDEYKRHTGWDNIPAARLIQEESWQIYIETGSWSNPRQLELHQRAEQIRRSENPMYTGRPTTGPIDQYDANKIALPTEQFVTTNFLDGLFGQAKTPGGASNIMGLGLIALMGVFVISLVRG
jgi:hypothetical protein